MGNESSGRKHTAQVVLRLLREEDLELVHRELDVMAATLDEWRDAFLDGWEFRVKPRNVTDSGRERPEIREARNSSRRLEQHAAAMNGSRSLEAWKPRGLIMASLCHFIAIILI
ncbi:hypothetical protein JCM15519_01820 [Fundidesulfovibrio butyratiphilus]